nr:hypothetical protein [bacterium]
MRVRTILWGLGIIAAACWIAWALTIVNTNPDQGGQVAVLSFYISLYVALVSTLALVGYVVRRHLG